MRNKSRDNERRLTIWIYYLPIQGQATALGAVARVTPNTLPGDTHGSWRPSYGCQIDTQSI